MLFGRARFAAGGGVEVDGRKLQARAYVIATGSVPTMLPIPGLDRVPVMTSDDVMRMTDQPRALVVQGAGPVGLELAQFFARVGTRVLQVNRSPLLSRFDADCGEELFRALADEENLELAVPGKIEKLEPRGSGLVATVQAGGRTCEYEADALLMAAGRHAALEDLGLEQAGVNFAGGHVEHDAGMRTSNPAIYVAGDATGSHQILHLANAEGSVAGRNAAGGEPESRMDYRLKMAVVFTDPPFAHVGATETEARREGREVVAGSVRFPETGRAITMSVRHGLWKLYADRENGEILGSSILGPRADDLVHTVATLMAYRADVDRVLELPWYHPTLSEVILNVARDAARKISETPGAEDLDPRRPDCEA